MAAIYRDRWQVELFFQALKQNLRIKTFVGTSSNAVRTQVWTALIAMLLLRYLQLRSSTAQAVAVYLAMGLAFGVALWVTKRPSVCPECGRVSSGWS